MKLLFKKYYTDLQEWFVLKNELLQLFIVILVSAIIIITSGFVLGSIQNSYLLFLDPTSLFNIKHTPFSFIFSFVLIISGLVMLGFVISVISTSMENTIRKIRMGKLNYIGKGHTLIINYNSILYDILHELNTFYEDIDTTHEVVLMTNQHDKVELLQDQLKRKKYKSLKVYVRYANLYNIERYKELSVLDTNSIIILGDEEIENEYARDNNNLKIVNSLYQNEEFYKAINTKQESLIPIKAIVTFSNNSYFHSVVTATTDRNFLSIAPKEVLNSVLNVSIIDTSFYNIWAHLLSFDGYELYFINPQDHDLIDKDYKEIVARQTTGLLVGISRQENTQFKILLNSFDEKIVKGDWLICIALNENEISFSTELSLCDSTHNIEQPQEVIRKSIAIIGEKRKLEENSFIQNNSSLKYFNENDVELFSIEFYETLYREYNRIVLNIDDEIIYRIGLFLITNFSPEQRESFIFLVDDSFIAAQLKHAGAKNTILSNILFSRYITQVSRQVTLNSVYKMLLSKEHADINTIEINTLSKQLQNNLVLLKQELINHKITYLGTITNSGEIVFESTTLNDMQKIIVLSDGEY